MKLHCYFEGAETGRINKRFGLLKLAPGASGKILPGCEVRCANQNSCCLVPLFLVRAGAYFLIYFQKYLANLQYNLLSSDWKLMHVQCAVK